MEYTARHVAMLLLEAYGCSLDTYKNDTYNKALEDVKSINPVELCGYTPERIAKELQTIGDTQDDPAALPYRVIYDTGNYIDAEYRDTFEEAKAVGLNMLADWRDEAPCPCPAWEWDSMVFDCGVFIEEYNKEKDMWYIVWKPSLEDLSQLHWKSTDEMTDEEKVMFGIYEED